MQGIGQERSVQSGKLELSGHVTFQRHDSGRGSIDAQGSEPAHGLTIPVNRVHHPLTAQQPRQGAGEDSGTRTDISPGFAGLGDQGAKQLETGCVIHARAGPEMDGPQRCCDPRCTARVNAMVGT